MVLSTKKLLSDLEALKKLTEPVIPPRGRLQALNILLALYLPGDTSGSGFGSAVVVIGMEGIIYESGTWVERWRKESSNFRLAIIS